MSRRLSPFLPLASLSSVENAFPKSLRLPINQEVARCLS